MGLNECTTLTRTGAARDTLGYVYVAGLVQRDQDVHSTERATLRMMGMS